jgi:hypothetical protein
MINKIDTKYDIYENDIEKVEHLLGKTIKVRKAILLNKFEQKLAYEYKIEVGMIDDVRTYKSNYYIYSNRNRLSTMYKFVEKEKYENITFDIKIKLNNNEEFWFIENEYILKNKKYYIFMFVDDYKTMMNKYKDKFLKSETNYFESYITNQIENYNGIIKKEDMLNIVKKILT